MERRTYNRSAIRLNAIIRDKINRSWPFVIEDFGYDGMCLKWESNEAMPADIKEDDLLDVQFSIEQKGEQQKYHLEVKVVRLLDNGLAVSLFNPALDSMLEISRKQQQKDPFNKNVPDYFSDKESQKIQKHIEKKFLNQLSLTIENFLPIVRESLFQRADNSNNNTEQTRYFDSINTLNKVKNNLKLQFMELMGNQLNLCCQHHTSNQQDMDLEELGLVDQTEFENWLTVNQLIVKSSPNYEQELLEIELRLAKLLAIEAKEFEFNPFSPDIIFKTFSETIHNYFSSNDILLILYHQFEKELDKHLLDTYKAINQIFIDNNILPIIDKKKFAVVKEPSTPQESSNPQEPTIPQQPSAPQQQPISNFEPSVPQEPLSNFGSSVPQESLSNLGSSMPQQPLVNQAASAPSNPLSNGQPQNINNTLSQLQQDLTASLYQLQQDNNSVPASHQPINTPQFVNTALHMTEMNTIENDINLVQTVQALKELVSFQNGQEFAQIDGDFVSSQHYTKQLNALIDELTVLQKHQGENLDKGNDTTFDLHQLVSKSIAKESYSIELNNEFNYSLDIVHRVFSFIKQEQWLDKPIKRLLSFLQIPLLKVFLLHKDFFESWSNPARMLVNKLAMLDCHNENDQLFIKARSFVLYLLKNYEHDLQIFSKTQDTLTQLLEIQSNEYNKKVNRIIKNWDARQYAIYEIASRLKGYSIPSVIVGFICDQWLATLVATYLHKGTESRQWSQYLQVLDMLLIISISGDTNDEFFDRGGLLFIIKQGLNETEQLNDKLTADIEALLKGDFNEEKITLNQDHMIKLLMNEYVLSDETATSTSSADKTLVQRLTVNDYMVYKHKRKETRLQLIWNSDDRDVFVFSGHSGQQEAVFNLEKVFSLLESGELSQTTDFDLPLLERSLYAMLGDVHDNIAQETSLDKVTGLMKRRDFESLFVQKVANKNQTGTDYAVCLINIDQFSLINDTYGFEAGDKYLSEIAQMIREPLASDVVAARYGVDEFVLLLPNYSEQEAQEVAESQRKAINRYNFCWEKKEFTLSASVGLVIIHDYKEAAIFLKAVVTASTIAKEQGRNRVHLLESDDLELDRRQELQQWATRVDTMVKNNQLDIRCQRLHPLIEGTLVPHYEMLLLVKDEMGNTISPAEFIEAAELYNKMAEVDRWVIKYVFQWFSDHPEQLKQMGGVAINLSGHSLNDVDFLAFIQDVFAQYPIPSELICFEVTETVAIANMEHAIASMHAIKKLGCEFSLDDFGTGLSSYAYLKNLPVDYLKIDGVFIKDIVNNKADQAMVKSINEIGHFLGMKTVAEYVENETIMSLLKDIGVDYAQGFGVEKPFLISEYVQYDSVMN